MQGKVLELFITMNDENKTRKSVDKISLDILGIKGDKFYDKDPMRSVLLTSQDSYELSHKNGIDLSRGSLGENIVMDINPYSLSCGDKLQIGSTLFEITQNCTLCKGLSTVNAKLPKLLKESRGIFAKVIEGNSEILLGDKVEILNY
ncbi:MAG: MOSC domain-containing protein [Campylobacterota bacterium]|nr:MOSC domain-containing protein [Campylobacterota bacterium]